MSASSEAGEGAAAERARLREGLLDQLAHLVREVDMLEGVIGRVPEKLLRETPAEATHSIKETFALMARLDEAVHAERIRRIRQEETPRLAPAPPAETLLADPGEEEIREAPMAALFERVRTARRGLIETVDATEPQAWLRTGVLPETDDEGVDGTGDPPGRERDLYWMAHAICQRDAARLEAMTRRLYESHMGEPENA